MSCRYGTLYSRKKGFASFSGRYRVTLIVAMSWLNLSIDTLFRFPSGYRDGTVIDPWSPRGLVCHRVREKVSIVPFRIVGLVVGLTRFATCTRFPKLGLSIFTADPAAALPAAAPKTKHSVRELLPSLLAPFMLTHATSPAAYSPGIPVNPCMSVCTPPIM